MKLEHIKIGETYKVVGKEVRCSIGLKSCSICSSYYNSKIIVKGIFPEYKYTKKGRIVNGMSAEGSSTCYFHPDDLEPIKVTNWKQKIGGK